VMLDDLMADAYGECPVCGKDTVVEVEACTLT
jgi:hypothetical protein